RAKRSRSAMASLTSHSKFSTMPTSCCMSPNPLSKIPRRSCEKPRSSATILPPPMKVFMPSLT
ncbi:hypothetical protein LTR94_038853, partial [Friedmanniomyces endolithicus]